MTERQRARLESQELKELIRCVGMEDLPDSHRKLAEAAGVDAALKLFEVFGSEQLYIPKNDRVKGYIRRRDIHEAYYGEGMTVSGISMDFQISERTVQRIISMRLDEIRA